MNIKKLSRKIGIDSTIAITILTRIIQVGSGVISVFFVTRFLTPNEQGYYYTFGSILAIQVFFELGLSGIITQFTAHEFANLTLNKNNYIEGEDYYKSRLSSLLRFCVKCFASIAFILFFILLASGYYFFNKYNKDSSINWHQPWLLLCLTTSLNLFIDPILGFFDGLGDIKHMSKVRLIQKGFNVIIYFALLSLGFKLYAAPLASLFAILINYFQIGINYRLKLLVSIWRDKKEWSISYYKEIFPFQWKIALSWISGYFIFSLFNPVIFATEGAKVAGQMGMTLAALSAISTLSMSWINTKVPLFSGLVAQNNYLELDTVFNKTVRQLSFVNASLVIFFLAFVFALRKLHISLGDRFLATLPLILLSSTVIANQYISSWAVYLRSHKKEPYLVLSLVLGVLCLSSTFILGNKFGLIGIVSGYTFITLGVGVVWGYAIFEKSKHKWHG